MKPFKGYYILPGVRDEFVEARKSGMGNKGKSNEQLLSSLK
jgi:hypothetical protein